MDIIFFCHPDFAAHQSMPRFTRMLAYGMEKNGHNIQIWSPKARIFNLPIPRKFKKWAGYIDQYVLFPREIRKRLCSVPQNTLFVFTDHALGPWVPLTANRFQIIHCHDFLAQRSAIGEISENKISWSGKQYQAYIRRGYQKGKNFISVSEKTKEDLERFLNRKPTISKVVYNGLNNKFEPANIVVCRAKFGTEVGIDLAAGYLLHVGGNQWYKNRMGVIEIYDAWRNLYPTFSLPLILIGECPSKELVERCRQSLFENDIKFLSEVNDTTILAAYAGATLFLFPSLAEGFGWPIAEAMACGCPVITTNEAPMTEVAGNAAFLIDRCPTNKEAVLTWANNTATIVNKLLQMNIEDRKQVTDQGIANAKRFDADHAINEIEKVYLSIVNS